MQKQMVLFGEPEGAIEGKYTSSIEAPIYEPKHTKPHLELLCDTTLTKALIREIDAATISDQEKEFLRAAAWRHAVFHYERIADYYAHAGVETQRLMERSALVIIDFDQAVERGFVRLCSDIRAQYYEEFSDDAT